MCLRVPVMRYSTKGCKSDIVGVDSWNAQAGIANGTQMPSCMMALRDSLGKRSYRWILRRVGYCLGI